MKKQYRAVFFDWDGTAVVSRKAPADAAAARMAPLLEKGIKLVIVSGTTMENIAGGKLESFFTEKQLGNLYLGLGRGAFNYEFRGGKPVVFEDRIPDGRVLADIHRISFDVHMELLEKYGFQTDIVFSRPNYCKIDLMAENQRGENLFMQENEIELLRERLRAHGIGGGLGQLLDMAVEDGKRYGIVTAPTCDAKYLEVGISSKSDNVDCILGRLEREFGILPGECCYWGDEFVGIEEGIFGSDSFMRTEKTRDGDFFDVSEVPGSRPEGVLHVGGGIERFHEFLRQQA